MSFAANRTIRARRHTLAAVARFARRSQAIDPRGRRPNKRSERSQENSRSIVESRFLGRRSRATGACRRRRWASREVRAQPVDTLSAENREERERSSEPDRLPAESDEPSCDEQVKQIHPGRQEGIRRASAHLAPDGAGGDEDRNPYPDPSCLPHPARIPLRRATQEREMARLVCPDPDEPLGREDRTIERRAATGSVESPCYPPGLTKTSRRDCASLRWPSGLSGDLSRSARGNVPPLRAGPIAALPSQECEV